ncbi:MAG: molybdate ABC transporter substrate-binding protein [Chloroflexi bacterium]|nr:molybdate ABC transporter substrate-binding protein [Chloroflexota bacterium]MCC6892432.1 molybdate ABC transporter substrate-binding protein [Anaerolineae bacterium]
MKRRLLSLVLVVLLLSLSLAGITSAQDTQTLTVFAASSLTDAFTEIGDNFKTAHEGVDVVFNFGSSSTLATQLTEGAPADIFASANARQMTVASDAGRIGGKPQTFAKNRLILVVPADNPANIQSLHDLANEGVKLVVAAPGVPVRDYTDAMIEKLLADPNFGEDYKTAFYANVVSEEDNVRQVSAKVALGEADAGLVYKSDVTPDIADQVIAFPIPDAINTLATYPIAATDNTATPELAAEFIGYILSDEGQDILTKWGFISVRIPELAATVSLPTNGTFTVDGQVLNSLSLTIDALKADYTSHTTDVTYKSGEDTVTASFTGVSLWDILGAAQPNFNTDVKNDKLSTFIVATGSDGYQAVIAWGEIDPEFGSQPILVAFERDGETLELPTLVIPGDARGGRYVSGLVNLSLRDAPTVSQ